MSTHAYWRINVTQNNTDAYVAIADMELRDSIGGSNIATGGTPICSSQFDGSQSAAKAFDG